MPSLVYNPGIKIYIDTGPTKQGLIDVSDDCLDGSMVRRSDGVSSFNFTLQNTRRKYDSLFTPNDRVIVMMKRLVWVRVFSGYLNQVPLVTAWPRPVTLTASCTLKRIQYWYWDAYTQASLNLVLAGMMVANNDPKTTDGGIAQVVNLLLTKVAQWPSSAIHVGRIPADWYVLASQIATQVEGLATSAEEFAQRMQATTSAAGVSSGVSNSDTTGSFVNGSLQDGTYKGVTLKGEQCRNAEAIYDQGKAMVANGINDHDIAIAIMTAMTESSLHNDPYGDIQNGKMTSSLGLFQQQAPWGPASVRMNPKLSAQKFYWALSHTPVAQRDSRPMWYTAQDVQGSEFNGKDGRPYGSNYRMFADMGLAVVAAINGTAASAVAKQPGSGAGGAADTTVSTPATGATVGTDSASALTSVALTLVNTYKVPYDSGGGSGAMSNLVKKPPASLDCSSFVLWCYLNTLGHLYGLPRTAHEQYAFCAKAGLSVSVQQALSIPGALVFVGSTPGGIHHVEMSLGDGQTTVGAHRPGTVASEGNANPSYWNYGALLPRINYAGAKVGQVARDSTAPGANVNQDPLAQTVPYYKSFQSQSTDPIDTIFGQGSQNWAAIPFDPAAMALSGTLSGVLTLLNDQPLLPYIINLMNSTMRSFCSAPNGDFMAWFPDYYGLWGTAGKMIVEPIEVMDFAVYWTDDYFVTHQFTLAGKFNTLDVGSGSVSTEYGATDSGDVTGQIYSTHGIASIDIPAMLTALFGIEATDTHAFAQFVYKQFGARPNFMQMDGMIGYKAEFFAAMYLFMRQWAYQYNADIPLTFMPEMWPGMLIQIPKFDFQAYVTTVTHSFSFGDGGGFKTSVNIAAPARMPNADPKDRSHVLLGMPTAGDYRPGLQTALTVTSAEVNVIAKGAAARAYDAAVANQKGKSHR